MTYKVIFAHNEVISLTPVLGPSFEFSGSYYYEQEKGNLIFALVRADNERQAVDTSDYIVKAVTSDMSGKDFII